MGAVQSVLKAIKGEKWKRSDRVMTMGEMFHNIVSLFIIRLNPYWERKVIYEVPLEELPQPMIVMSCHRSFADPLVVSGAIPESKAIAQSSIFDYPIFGSIFKNNGDLPVYFAKIDGKWRTKPGSTEELMQKAKDYLAEGVSVGVFPEGTISKDEEMKPFKPGFFKLALETGTPIVPVALEGNETLWPMKKHIKDVSVPENYLSAGRCYVKVGAPIDPEDYGELDALMTAVRGKIQSMREELMVMRKEDDEREAQEQKDFEEIIEKTFMPEEDAKAAKKAAKKRRSKERRASKRRSREILVDEE